MSKHNEELHAVPSLLELAEQLENKAAEEKIWKQTQDKEDEEEARTAQQTGKDAQPEDTDKNDQAPQPADEDTRRNDHAEQSTHGEPDKTSEKPAPAGEDAKQTNRVSAGVASTGGASETSIVPPKTKAEAYTLAKTARTFKVVFIGVRFFFLLLPLLALLVATVSGVVFPAPIIFAYPILLLLSLGQLDKGRVAVNVAANILTLLSLPFLWGITMSLYKIFMTPGIMLCAFELFCAVYSLAQASKISKGYIQLGEGGRHLYEKYVTAEDLPRETSLSNITPPAHPDTPEKPAENPEEGTESSVLLRLKAQNRPVPMRPQRRRHQPSPRAMSLRQRLRKPTIKNPPRATRVNITVFSPVSRLYLSIWCSKPKVLNCRRNPTQVPSNIRPTITKRLHIALCG